MSIAIQKPLNEAEIGVLRALQQDAERQRKEIAFDLHMSQSKLSKVVADLVARGYIRKTAAILDPKNLCFGYVSFFRVRFKDFTSMEKAEAALAARPEIQEIYGTGRGFELFIKMHTNSNEKLVDFKFELGSMEGVKRVRMFSTLHTIKSETDLPI